MRKGDRIRDLEHRVAHLEQALMALRDRPLPVSPTPYSIQLQTSWTNGTVPEVTTQMIPGHTYTGAS